MLPQTILIFDFSKNVSEKYSKRIMDDVIFNHEIITIHEYIISYDGLMYIHHYENKIKNIRENQTFALI